MKNENEEKNHSTIVIEAIAANFTKGNQKAVALKIGVAQSTLASWKERNNADMTAIAAAFPEVSAEWLLRGEGQMLKSHDQSRNYTINGNSNTQFAEGCTIPQDTLGTLQYFRNIGAGEMIETAINRLFGQLDTASTQLHEKDTQLHEKDAQLKEKDSQLKAKDSQLQAKDSQLQAKDSQISSLLDIIKSQTSKPN